jgi:hypothetical protein
MHKMGGFLQVNSVFFRLQITFVALQYLKIIKIWQFVQNEAQVYVFTGFHAIWLGTNCTVICLCCCSRH